MLLQKVCYLLQSTPHQRNQFSIRLLLLWCILKWDLTRMENRFALNTANNACSSRLQQSTEIQCHGNPETLIHQPESAALQGNCRSGSGRGTVNKIGCWGHSSLRCCFCIRSSKPELPGLQGSSWFFLVVVDISYFCLPSIHSTLPFLSIAPTLSRGKAPSLLLSP